MAICVPCSKSIEWLGGRSAWHWGVLCSVVWRNFSKRLSTVRHVSPVYICMIGRNDVVAFQLIIVTWRKFQMVLMFSLEKTSGQWPGWCYTGKGQTNSFGFSASHSVTILYSCLLGMWVQGEVCSSVRSTKKKRRWGSFDWLGAGNGNLSCCYGLNLVIAVDLGGNTVHKNITISIK